MGDPVDPAKSVELEYQIHSSWHLGMIASGSGVGEFLRKLQNHTHPKLLTVVYGGSSWVWLGGQRRPQVADVENLFANEHAGLSLAIGEPGKDLTGWRLTHNQAKDALRIALRRPDRFASYADNRLLASTLPNETLVESLKQTYIAPLSNEKDGGLTLRRTLRTYIDVECNATSASYALKVGRRAVKSRVHTAERLIGHPLHKCLAEIQVALSLQELE